jgi:hypothetical protein
MRTGLNVYIKVDKLKQFRAACRQLDITASRKAVELIEAWLAHLTKWRNLVKFEFRVENGFDQVIKEMRWTTSVLMWKMWRMMWQIVSAQKGWLVLGEILYV